jgi:hypothetical protein
MTATTTVLPIPISALLVRFVHSQDMQAPLEQIISFSDPTESRNEWICCCVSASSQTVNQAYVNSSPIHNISVAIVRSVIRPIDADSVSVLR